MKSKANYEVIVIGGGAAGLSAALVLGRARRLVALIDAGTQSNKVSLTSHGVFTRDGASPVELYKIASSQLKKYNTVRIIDNMITDVTKSDVFLITLKSGQTISGKAVLLAQGINYQLPDIPGAQDLYGTKIWHCPFCDGYEATHKKILAVGNDEWIQHMLKLLPTWTDDITWCTVGKISKRTQSQISKTVPKIEKIEEIGKGIQALTGGISLNFDQAVMQTKAVKRDDLADALGCKRTKDGDLKVDKEGRTSVAGVFAAGDQASSINQVNVAVASGHAAGIGIHLYLADA